MELNLGECLEGSNVFSYCPHLVIGKHWENCPAGNLHFDAGEKQQFVVTVDLDAPNATVRNDNQNCPLQSAPEFKNFFAGCNICDIQAPKNCPLRSGQIVIQVK